MVKAKPRNLIPIILALLLSFGTYLPLTTPAVSAEKVESNNYETGFPMSIALKQLEGKYVGLTLMSGDKIEGLLKEVGPDVVHLVYQQDYLSKTTGKSYRDALIRIESISAVAVRVRR
jgi:hypothetical protein